MISAIMDNLFMYLLFCLKIRNMPLIVLMPNVFCYKLIALLDSGARLPPGGGKRIAKAVGFEYRGTRPEREQPMGGKKLLFRIAGGN